MNTLPVFVGLDYHDKSVQVCVLNAGGKVLLNRGCDNDWRQIVKIVEPLGPVKRAAIEACCGAADLTEELVTHAGWHVDLAHPQYVARLKQSARTLGQPTWAILANAEKCSDRRMGPQTSHGGSEFS